MGFKSNGDRCLHPDNGFISFGASHLSYCTTHWSVYDRRVQGVDHHIAGTCHTWINRTKHWCGHACTQGDPLICEEHKRATDIRRGRREAILADRTYVREALTWYRRQPMTWREQVDHLILNGGDTARWVLCRVAYAYFTNPTVVEPDLREEFQFGLYWRWAIGGRIGPPPVLVQPAVQRTQLAALAEDAQNVHTHVVTTQTNKGLEKLLAMSKDCGISRVPEWFAIQWLSRAYGTWEDVCHTVTDMKFWYDTALCKMPDDWLYRNVLNGLFLILESTTDGDVRDQLFLRAFEECMESNGMCCEGHISRLCNVLVGFDDAFEPQVPFGERLQRKMAEIHAMPMEPKEKKQAAIEFFNTHAVPEAERHAWLEALEQGF